MLHLIMEYLYNLLSQSVFKKQVEEASNVMSTVKQFITHLQKIWIQVLYIYIEREICKAPKNTALAGHWQKSIRM